MLPVLSGFSTADIILTLIFIFAFFYGFYKGFISLASPFIAVFLSFNASVFLRPFILKYFAQYFQNKASILISILILIILYAIFRIILSKVERVVKGFLKSVFLGWVDRLCGGLVSFFIAFILILLFFIVIREFIYPSRNVQNIFDSKIADFIIMTVRKVGIFQKII